MPLNFIIITRNKNTVRKQLFNTYLQILPGMHGYVFVISMRREKCPTDKHFSAKVRNCLTKWLFIYCKKKKKKKNK